MKETTRTIQVKAYTDDGKQICFKCAFAPRDSNRTYPALCHFGGRENHPLCIAAPGPSCPVWHGESKGEDPRYMELIMAVSRKHAGETRHETHKLFMVIKIIPFLAIVFLTLWFIDQKWLRVFGVFAAMLAIIVVGQGVFIMAYHAILDLAGKKDEDGPEEY